MSTGLHNGFTEGFPNNPTTIDHTTIGDVANLVGVFGNKYLPDGGSRGRRDHHAGLRSHPLREHPDLSVQHPSEDCIFDRTVEPAGALLHRPIELLDLTGQVFTQNRTVPRGSNWPSNIAANLNGPPRPCVIAI